MPIKLNKKAIGLSAAGAALLIFSCAQANASQLSACLITKTDNNPYWITMQHAAAAKAKALGIKLYAYAGKYDGDNATQVNDVQTCVANQVDAIIIAASSPKGIAQTLDRAHKAGVLIIAVDTLLNPVNTAQVTFATDNFEAGQLDGEWALKTLGAKAKSAKIGMVDLAINQPSVGVERDQGFMKGFGINIKNPNKWGDETDPRIVGHAVSGGAENGGLKAMEQLLAINNNINLVYAINEPAAFGAYQALKSSGRAGKATLVAIDGSCPGIQWVKQGIIDADAMQFPQRMVVKALETVVQYKKDGTVPKPSKGLSYFNTGVKLVTAHPVPGVPSITPAEGAKICWGYTKS